MRIAIKIVSILSFCLIHWTNTAEAKRLFVFNDKTGVINEYSVEDFGLKQVIQIPKPKKVYFLSSKTEARIISKGLRINESGHILYYVDYARVAPEGVLRMLWLWDGGKERQAEISLEIRCFPGLCEKISGPFLDAEEAKIYWTIDRVTKFCQELIDTYSFRYYVTLDVEIYRVYFGDTSSGKLVEESIAKIPFKEYKCWDTCPTSRIVTPKDGIKDFIEIELFVQGTIASIVEGHTYFEKRGDKWIETSIDKKLEKPFIEIIYDSGCCGWENESSDLLLVIDGKNRKIIYDEWKQFDNRNYDVSFYIANAELSPNSKKITYTITPDQWAMSNYKRTGTFRLSADGKENLRELEKIKAALSDHPMVEIKSIVDETKDTLVIKNAEFVGWIDNNRLLLLKNGMLCTFNILSQRYFESSISIESIENVFLR